MNGPKSQRQVYRWTFGAAEFDEAAQLLSIGGVKVHLEAKSARLLEVLLRHAGEVVTHIDLRKLVWDNRLTDYNVLPTAIGKVRAALNGVPEVSIVTMTRVGYKFVGHVNRELARAEYLGQFKLSAGDEVPLRPEFELVESLANRRGAEVWLARNRQSAEYRVYKFATEENHLALLRNEAALSREIQESLNTCENVVQVLGWNFSDAPYFLEGEYAGQNLRAWALVHFPRLNREQRLAIFLQIARAVAVAHGVGILHKNIKPENIFIDASLNDSWRIKLADFSIGRILEKENIESTVSIALETELSGTVVFYLAPEVINGNNLSTRSDVYALGVLLFQFIVADFLRPLASGWQRDVIDELLIEDISAATDHNPDCRTASVNHLIEQLLRIEQRRVERVHKREQEQRLRLSEAALEQSRARRPWMLAAVTSLTFAMFLSLWLYGEATERRKAAERYSNGVSTVVRFLAEDLFAQANPVDPRFDRESGSMSLLDNASREIDTRFRDEPLALAAMNRALAGAYRALGKHERTKSHFREAIRLFAEQLGADNENTLEARYGLVQALAIASEFVEANAELELADGSAHNYLNKANAIAFESALSHGLVKTHEFKPVDALFAYDQALALIEQGLVVDIVKDGAVRLGAIDSLLRLGQIDRAVQMLGDLEAKNTLPKANQPELQRFFARALKSRGDYAGALPHAQRTLLLYREVYGADHWNSIIALSSLSHLQLLLDNCPAALQLADEAYQRMRDAHGPDKQGTLIELGNRGSRRFDCGEHELGLQDLYAARDGLRSNFGVANAPAQSFAFSLAGYLGEAKRYPEALSAIESLGQDAVAAIQAGGAITMSESKLGVLHAKLLFGSGEVSKAAQMLLPAIDQLHGGENQDLLDEASALQKEICEKGYGPACTSGRSTP